MDVVQSEKFHFFMLNPSFSPQRGFGSRTQFNSSGTPPRITRKLFSFLREFLFRCFSTWLYDMSFQYTKESPAEALEKMLTSSAFQKPFACNALSGQVKQTVRPLDPSYYY